MGPSSCHSDGMSNINFPGLPGTGVTLLMHRVGRGGGTLSIRVTSLFLAEFEIHLVVSVTDLSDNLTVFNEPVLI